MSNWHWVNLNVECSSALEWGSSRLSELLFQAYFIAASSVFSSYFQDILYNSHQLGIYSIKWKLHRNQATSLREVLVCHDPSQFVSFPYIISCIWLSAQGKTIGFRRDCEGELCVPLPQLPSHSHNCTEGANERKSGYWKEGGSNHSKRQVG